MTNTERDELAKLLQSATKAPCPINRPTTRRQDMASALEAAQ